MPIKFPLLTCLLEMDLPSNLHLITQEILHVSCSLQMSILKRLVTPNEDLRCHFASLFEDGKSNGPQTRAYINVLFSDLLVDISMDEPANLLPLNLLELLLLLAI